MSTTVTYKGSALTTVNNQTRTLKTAGKYMEDDVTLVDVGPSINSLTVTPTSEQQIFDKYYTIKNLGTFLKSTRSGTILTISVNLSDIEYGQTYHIKCNSILVSNASQFSNEIKIDTDWIASEGGEVPFEYISHDGTWNIEQITLSKTSLVIEYSSNNHEISFNNTNHDFIIQGIADGYKPVTVNAIPSTYVQPTGTYSITTNGTYNIASYASAEVNVSGGATVNNQNKTVTPTTSQQSISADSGYTGLGIVTVNAIPSQYIVPSGNLAITANGTGIDVTQYASVSVDVPTGSTINNQDKTVTPTESQQTITADSGYTGLGTITVNAISSTYVGSGITRRTDTDITTTMSEESETSGQLFVNIPNGYYINNANKIIPVADFDNPSVSYSWRDGEFTIRSSVTTPGYLSTGFGARITPNDISGITVITSSTITPTESTQVVADKGTFVVSDITVDAIPSTYVGSGITQCTSDDLTVSGATVSVPAGYYGTVASKSVASGSATAPASISGTAASVSTGSGTLTLTKTVSVTPTVSAGYITSGTAGNSSVSLTTNVAVNPTLTVSGPTVTAPAGYYTENASQSVATMTPPSEPSNNYTSGYTRLKVIDRATSTRYINIPPGYNSTGVYYQISAVYDGHATTPATTITANPTITISDSGLITATTSASQSVTPTVSAGYVSSGTAGTITVSGSKTQQLTTKAAATITPTTTNQTIASGTYLTGTQTILGDPDLVGPNIVAGASIFNINGTATFQHYYTGSSAPASSLGENGDIYLQA